MARFIIPPQDAGAKVIVSETPPENAKEGSLWYHSPSGNMYILYQSVWVQTIGSFLRV